MHRRWWTIALALAGCGADPEPTWADFDRDERLVYMTTVVEPAMREIFQSRDPVRWADFTCDTCHGDDLATTDYEMPQVLPALPLVGTLDAARDLDPELTDFMLADVFPAMVDLLGYEKYNADTMPDGFRCVGCHVVQ